MATYTLTSMGYNLLPSKYTHTYIYIYCDNKRVLTHIEYIHNRIHKKAHKRDYVSFSLCVSLSKRLEKLIPI